MTQELLTVSDVKFKFVNVTENMEADIKKAVEHQLANKGQTILNILLKEIKADFTRQILSSILVEKSL